MTDVLVVGAGPTGLMLANCLLRLGVTVMVVDPKSGPTRESRALAVQARTMEIYDQLGVADEVLAGAEQAVLLSPGFERRRFRPVPVGALGAGLTPYPRVYTFEQSKNEALLLANLERLGGSVHFGHRLTGLETGDGVLATVAGPDGDVTIRARYCVGADGGNSTVRQLRGIAFEGVTNQHTFYVIDATRARGLTPGAVNVRPGRRDFLLTFPMGPDGHHRLIGVVRDQAHRGDITEDITEDQIRDRLLGVFGVAYGPSRWFSLYHVHHRVAAAFRDGPVFLAGDAAHVHSPVGAQGMNTGLQDAHNLACTLADVLHGRAAEASLDRYEAERRPVARRLVATTDRVFGLVTSEGLVVRTLRRALVPVLAPLVARLVPRASGASRLFGYVSQIRIHYRSLDADGRRDPVVGRRLPWTGENFDVLRSLTWQAHAYGTVDPDLLTGIDTEVHTFGAHPERGLPDGTLLLVRPDGFVAARYAATAGRPGPRWRAGASAG